MALSSIQGITIPKKGKSVESLLEDLGSKFESMPLSKEEQEWFDREKKRVQFKKEEERIAQLQLKYNSPQMYKIKNKLSKTYDKYLANGAWFKASLKMFSNMGKKAGSWLMDILKFIFLLAIFDPKGKFLNSIVDFILKMVMWFVDILIQYLPKIIRIMIYLITEVIPKVLKKIVSALSDMIYKMFGAMIKEMPDGPLKSTMKFIQSGFGKDGILTKFFSKLADFFPIFLIVLGVLKVISLLTPIFSLLSTVWGIISFILPFLSAGFIATAGALWAVLAPLLPFILAAAALGAALYFLWKYADEVSNFFDGLIDRFKKMSGWMKALVVVLSLVFFPITLFIGAIYGIVKLFKSFKKIGVANTFKAMGKGIVNMAKGAKDWVASKASDAWQGTKNLANNVKEKIGEGIDWAKGLATKLKEAIKNAWQEYIVNTFSGWFDKLNYYFKYFINYYLGGRDTNKAAVVSFYEMKGASTEEAENMFNAMKNDPSKAEAFYKMVSEATGTPLKEIAKHNDSMVRAISALMNKLGPTQAVTIDRRAAFALSVTNIK